MDSDYLVHTKYWTGTSKANFVKFSALHERTFAPARLQCNRNICTKKFLYNVVESLTAIGHVPGRALSKKIKKKKIQVYDKARPGISPVKMG